ncbi:PREDICTED: uncharacterized protein LOC109588287 [Amphimedon queenslandica]|uniref:SAM domain-containing protein n=1 Tax=Amphimedon queenslandica TaxID=400682 RepID=A0AAN0JSZ4_AMPQE|nr:PREDICTED: uncharacterized protein LOC109588287 [Amphimedon queenslandica]|eukprot:XP_019860014.1 PREDICTED: uncharacterized protein LOC109588287 [Amphimedon queenslandica]
MKAVPLPRVVYVNKHCTASLGKEGGEENIEVGTLLLIQGVEKVKSRFGKVNMLKCVKITDDTRELYLAESCKGQFTTQESLIRFPLTALLKYFEAPITTTIYHGKGNSLHSRCKNKIIVIESKSITMSTSIIVSLGSTSATIQQQHKPLGKLLEIHTNISLGFYISSCNGKETEDLKQKAVSLSQSLSPEQVTVLYTLGLEDSLQRDLLSPVNNKEWLHEIQTLSETIYDSAPVVMPKATKKAAVSSLPKPQLFLASHDPKMNCFLSEVTEKKVESYTHSHSDAFSSQSSHQKLTIAVQDNSAYGMVVPKGFHIKSSEKPKLSVVTSSTSINPSTIVTSTKSPESFPEKPRSKTFLDFNRSTLASYDIKKVVDLLVKMRLEQYAETFQREQIDGKILLELDESVLKEELGMTKRIHRLKLLNIINGDQCISFYLK